jgi:uncharacterized protein (DUF3820 family)
MSFNNDKMKNGKYRGIYYIDLQEDQAKYIKAD